MAHGLRLKKMEIEPRAMPWVDIVVRFGRAFIPAAIRLNFMPPGAATCFSVLTQRTGESADRSSEGQDFGLGRADGEALIETLVLFSHTQVGVQGADH